MPRMEEETSPVVVTTLTGIGVVIGVLVAILNSDVILGVIAGASFIAFTVGLVLALGRRRNPAPTPHVTRQLAAKECSVSALAPPRSAQAPIVSSHAATRADSRASRPGSRRVLASRALPWYLAMTSTARSLASARPSALNCRSAQSSGTLISSAAGPGPSGSLSSSVHSEPCGQPYRAIFLALLRERREQCLQPGARAVVRRLDPGEHRPGLAQVRFDDRLDQVVLGLEVVVDVAERYAGRGRDVRERGPLDATGVEHLARGVDQPLPLALPLCRARLTELVILLTSIDRRVERRVS